MMTEKKEYVQPRLTVLGDVEKITLGGVLANADVPSGPNNTAACAAGSTNPLCLS